LDSLEPEGEIVDCVELVKFCCLVQRLVNSPKIIICDPMQSDEKKPARILRCIKILGAMVAVLGKKI